MIVWLSLLTLGTILGFLCVYISFKYFLKKIVTLRMDIDRIVSRSARQI